MLWEKIKKFWKAGLTEKNRISSLFIVAGIAASVMAGCSNELPEVPENRETVVDHEVYPSSEDDFDNAESIAAVYRDIYDEAVETNTLGSPETLRRIVARLGENGYVAVDSENQVDMAGAEQAIVERQIVANPNIKLNLSFFTLFPQIIPAFSSILSDYS